MIKDSELVRKIYEESRVDSSLGMYPIVYKIKDDYFCSTYANKPYVLTNGRESLGKYFRLSVPGYSIVELEHIAYFKVFFKPIKVKYWQGDTNKYILFNRDGQWIFEKEELADFYLVCAQERLSEDTANKYDFYIYHNCNLVCIIAKSNQFFYHQYDFDTQGFRFSRISHNPEITESEIWIYSNGIERRVTEADELKFYDWCWTFRLNAHLLDSYCKENELPYDSPSLFRNDDRFVKWKCSHGHTWMERMCDRTKSPVKRDTQACPVCQGIIANASVLTELLKEMELAIKSIDIGQFYIDGFEESKDLVSCYMKHPINKQSGIAMKIAQEAAVIEQINYDYYKISFTSTQIENMVKMHYCFEAMQYNLFIKGQDNIKDFCNDTELVDFLNRYSIHFRLEQLRQQLEIFRFSDSWNKSAEVLSNQARDIEVRYANRFRDMLKELYITMVDANEETIRWVSEKHLYLLVKSFFKDAIFQYSTEWLGLQILDIFIPSINVGIEYQGKQHFEAIDFFGGEEALEQNKLRDKTKRERCQRMGVKLIEWLWREEICIENLTLKLSEVGVVDTHKVNQQ